MENTKISLGTKIKKLRILRNMTQKELVGDRITRNMLSEIESGTANPSLTTLIYLAERLNISPAYFFVNDEDVLYFDKEWQNLSVYDFRDNELLFKDDYSYLEDNYESVSTSMSMSSFTL